MRLFLSLAFVMIALIPQPAKQIPAMTTPTSSITSPELQSLKNDIHELETKLQTSRGRQDFWNGWYLKLGVAALGLGTALGVASWVCQKRASTVEYSSRPDADKLAAKNARIRELLDQAAQVEVAHAGQRAASAEKGAELAKIGAAEAVIGQKQVAIELARQQERAAKAEKDLLELQGKVNDRDISATQLSAFQKSVAKMPRGFVSIVAMSNSGESMRFAEKLGNMLSSSGFSVSVHSSLLAGSGIGVGLTLVITSIKPVDRTNPAFTRMTSDSGAFHGAILVNGFIAAQIPVFANIRDRSDKDSVVLYVGTKP